jgi:glycosyltransferase involved in cell wall biosynthesis
MKILHVITSLSTGGAERMLVKIINETLSQSNHRVVSLGEIGTQGLLLKELGIPVYNLKITNFIKFLISIRTLFFIIKKEKPDIIQGWMYHGNLAASLAGWLRNGNFPVVYNIRHSLYDINKEKKATQWVIRLNSWLSRKTSGVIYNSRISGKQHEAFGFCSNKSIIIPNGFDIKEYKFNKEDRNEIRQEFNIGNDVLLFAQVGRNHPMKDHANFIKASANFLKKYKNAHFILVGKNIDSDFELNQIINKLGIGDKMTLCGERNDIKKVWNAVDYAVLSSSWGEAFPNVLGEAMLCEVPCIATDVGDSKYIIGETGRIVNPNNSDELAEAMLNYAKLSQKERYKLGIKARQRIINIFSLESVAKKYLDLYQLFIRN